jgi:hypothetical protein
MLVGRCIRRADAEARGDELEFASEEHLGVLLNALPCEHCGYLSQLHKNDAHIHATAHRGAIWCGGKIPLSCCDLPGCVPWRIWARILQMCQLEREKPR